VPSILPSLSREIESFALKVTHETLIGVSVSEVFGIHWTGDSTLEQLNSLVWTSHILSVEEGDYLRCVRTCWLAVKSSHTLLSTYIIRSLPTVQQCPCRARHFLHVRIAYLNRILPVMWGDDDDGKTRSFHFIVVGVLGWAEFVESQQWPQSANIHWPKLPQGVPSCISFSSSSWGHLSFMNELLCTFATYLCSYKIHLHPRHRGAPVP